MIMCKQAQNGRHMLKYTKQLKRLHKSPVHTQHVCMYLHQMEHISLYDVHK